MFLSSYESGVDAKKRVSVPAAFRRTLRGEEEVFLWPSMRKACLEGGGVELIQKMHRAISRFGLYDPRREALSQAILGRARPFRLDEGGRIVLEGELMTYAGLTDRIRFVGLGDTFEVWEPALHQEHLAGLLAVAAEAAPMLDPFDLSAVEGDAA